MTHFVTPEIWNLSYKYMLLTLQIAIAYHNMRQVTEAVEKFQQLLSGIDPYRLDNLDIYSNLLYVNEQRVELAHLAHKR